MSGIDASVTQRRRFVLQRLIGKGSFGEVYLAEQDSGSGFTRPVAVKLLDESASRSREVARRMRDEARLLGRLRSRYIVDVYDLVRLGDRWGIVMEYVPGADLDQVLQRFEADGVAFSPSAAFAVGAAVARALELAWGADDGSGRALNVVHRDLKPANIRLSPEGDVKVLDFGVARFTLDAREASTRKPGWLGTERYMAPERILLEGDGPEGDVYALGATLVELILGRPMGRSPVREETHAPFIEEALTQVRARLEGPPEVVDAAVDLLRRMVAADPAARPSAAEVGEACRRLGPGLGGESLERLASRVPPGLGDAATMVPMTLTEGSSGGSGDLGVTTDAVVRRARAWPALGIAALVFLAVAGWALWPGSAPVVDAAPTEPAAQADLVPPVPSPSVAPAVVTPVQAAPEPPSAPVPSPASKPSVDLPAPTVRPAPPATVVRPAEPPQAPAPAAPVEVPPPPGPRVSKALVVVDNVDGFRVRCGDRSVEGTQSARLADFPAGVCEITAWVGGQAMAGSLRVERPAEVRCKVDGGSLRCS